MEALIEFTKGRLQGQIVYVRPSQDVAFGAGPGNYVSVEGEGLLPRHGVVRFDGADLVVEAAGEGADVRVGGAPAARHVLAQGSVVEAGGLGFTVVRIDREGAPPSPPPAAEAPASPPPEAPPASPPPPVSAAPAGPGIVRRAVRLAFGILVAFLRSLRLLPLSLGWVWLSNRRQRACLRVGREVCAQRGELQKTESLVRALEAYERVERRRGNLYQEIARVRASARSAVDRAFGRG